MSLLKALIEVHRQTKLRFVYVRDRVQHDMTDYWPPDRDIPDAPHFINGDCEDFALACRKVLRETYGIKPRLMYCELGEEGWHMVLECKGWILGNILKTVWARDDLDYRWIAISGYERENEWREVING